MLKCRFTRHLNTNLIFGCPLKGHLLDRPATGRLIIVGCTSTVETATVESMVTFNES